MYVQNYPGNLFDEQSRSNVDSSSRSALYKVSLNQVSHGAFSPGDYKDYYELTPGIGSFQIVVTSDPSNGFSLSAYAYAFDIKITDAQGNILLPADPTGPDIYSDSITFTSGGYSTYYLEITNTLFGSFAYGAVLLDPGNHAPVVSVPMIDENWTEGSLLQYTVPARTFTDPDGNALSYSATLNTGAALPAWLSFNSTTHTFTGTVPVGSPDYTVRVIVKDAGGLSTFDDVVFFTPAPVNHAPVVSAPMVDKNWIEGASLEYTLPTGTFTDPDGNTLSYVASLSGGAALPAWLSFNATTHTFSGTAPVGSPDYTVRVTVTDTSGFSTFDDVVFFTPATVNAATYVPFTPTRLIEIAMFNFDAFGISDYKLTGTVGVSVSDAFTAAQYHASPSTISSDIYTSLASGSAAWTTTQLNNINLVTSIYSNFINLGFSPVVNESGFTPSAVGPASNINISLIYRTDLSSSGESALGTDTSFGYAQSRGDIVLNVNGFGSSGLANDYSLDASSFGFHTLMHEIGHSIGLSHPHSSITNRIAVLTADYAATMNVGFDKLGFHIDSASDMNKEYFSVMSYDDQTPAGAPDTFAQTPMILDVIALQAAYGEGAGSSGTGDNTIAPGGSAGVGSYRSYFDTGGIDTIDLVNYATGAYLHMGTSIVSAAHLVGVSMSMVDANTMINAGGDPASLRWFYGEYENASGSAASDVIIGSSLNNVINGLSGDDTITGGAGNDTIDGGAGIDTAIFSSGRANYTVTSTGASYTIKSLAGTDGTDTLQNLERLKFSDRKLALDLAPAQHAGQALEFIGALAPTSIGVPSIVGLILGLFDQGSSLHDVCQLALDVGLVNSISGSSSNHALAAMAFRNLIGSEADAATVDVLVSFMDGRSANYSQADFLTVIAGLEVNQIHIGLVGLQQTGVEYI